MATMIEFMELLADAPTDDKHINTGKLPDVSIAIGPTDSRSAKLLLQLFAEYPDMTQGEIEDILDTAKWWLMYLGTTSFAHKLETE